MRRAAIALAALAAGCGAPEGVRLVAGDDGRMVEVAAGASVTITLDSNPSTGYRWQLVRRPEPGVLALRSATFEPPDAEGSVGRPGSQTWRFEAIGRGTTELALVYRRPWDAGSTSDRFDVVVRVS